jgi:hypothetical protein
MVYWIYDIPTLLAVGLFAAVFVGVCWLGTILSRPFVKPWFHEQSRLNEMLGDYLQYFGVIYGLLLGLLAVATYQNHTDVDKAVASEASSLATLYRDISAYPEPDRTELKDLIREYPARPSKTPGRCSVRGSIRGRSIAPPQSTHGLLYLSPQTKGQEALNAALRQFNEFFENRRTRLFSVTAGIPPIMWYTVAVGALINMLLIWLFDLRLGTHLLRFTGTMICLIVLLDNPFRGEVGASAQAFEWIYNEGVRWIAQSARPYDPRRLYHAIFVGISCRSRRSVRFGRCERFVRRPRRYWHHLDSGVEGRLVHRRIRRQRHVDLPRAALSAVDRGLERGTSLWRFGDEAVRSCEQHPTPVGRCRCLWGRRCRRRSRGRGAGDRAAKRKGRRANALRAASRVDRQCRPERAGDLAAVGAAVAAGRHFGLPTMRPSEFVRFVPTADIRPTSRPA